VGSARRRRRGYGAGGQRASETTTAYDRNDGTGARHGHTVAYDHGRIFDPKGSVYDYSRLACEAHQFYTRCAWRIDPIGERTCE
jgi:hypothetical protein